MVIAIYLVILVAAFYFLIVRPQRRQQAIRRRLIATVGLGDEVITSGGVFGTVVALEDETLDLEIAPGVVVKVARGAIAQLLVDASDDGSDGDEDEGVSGDGIDDGDDEPRS